MTADPAIAAAMKAMLSVESPTVRDTAIAAAREALAPLRANHQKVQRPDGSYRCTNCRDAYGAHADWPTGTDRLLYSEDEL